MEEDRLEPGSERLIRLLGAAFWSGFAGYLLGLTATDDDSFAWFLVKVAVAPALTLLFCVPRCAYASYLGRGFAAAGAFALGYAAGVDYDDIDPQREVTPALTFLVAWFFSCVILLIGLVPLGLAKAAMWLWRERTPWQ